MLNLLNQEKLLGGVDANSPIGTAQSQQTAREMTRKTRGGQQLSNEDVKDLQEKLKQLNQKLMDTTDPEERKIIKENIKEIKDQLKDARGQQSDLAETQAGTRTFATGGVTTTKSDYDYGSGGGGSGGGSSGSGSAFTKPPTN